MDFTAEEIEAGRRIDIYGGDTGLVRQYAWMRGEAKVDALLLFIQGFTGEFLGEEGIVVQIVDLPDDIIAGLVSLKKAVQVLYAAINIRRHIMYPIV
jgi:hypothetical protein